MASRALHLGAIGVCFPFWFWWWMVLVDLGLGPAKGVVEEEWVVEEGVAMEGGN